MAKFCSKDCIPVCDFCGNYIFNQELCTKYNKHKEPWEGKDCDDFECFTLNNSDHVRGVTEKGGEI